MKKTAKAKEKKNEDLNEIMDNITYKSKEESFEFENDEDYSYSKSNSSFFDRYLDNNNVVNTDKEKISNYFTFSGETGNFIFKMMIFLIYLIKFKILKEIQKKLAEDEFKDVADNLI